jgi:hypothetical protein
MVMASFAPGHIRTRSAAETERWRKAAHAALWIDLQADLKRFTVDAIAGLAFGTEVNTLLHETYSDGGKNRLSSVCGPRKE